MIDRRTLLLGLAGGACAVGPARSQSGSLPVVGFLNSATPELYEFNVAAFHEGLKEQGYVDGRNVRIEYRWARGDYARLATLATELVQSRVAVIAATGDIVSARAAQAATMTIPIVFTIGGDPVQYGLVASHRRPGGNTTGISLISSALVDDKFAGKRMEILHAVAPDVPVAMIMNPDNPNTGAELRDTREAARRLGHATLVYEVRNEHDLDAAFAAIATTGAGALFVGTDPMLLSRREPIVRFAERRRLPAIYWVREFVLAGGLFSYGASIRGMYREAGVYVGRILKGAKPAELPVVQPTLVEFVVNLHAARALGMTLPQSLLVRADEVIQ